MVCLGNICRSPLAEGILKAKSKQLNILVDSAGTSAYHIGEQPDIRSIAIAKSYGINISNQKARQFGINDFDKFDKIYAMDKSNYSQIISRARNQVDKDKVDLILNELNPESFQDVPDPYYGGENGFQDVYDLLNSACDEIVAKIG